MSLGSRIKDLRVKKKLTQSYLAQQLGMGRSNFGHIENDRVNPTSSDLEKIADILETTTDYLLGRDTDSIKETTVPYWATNKDIRDFKKMLEEEHEIMFDGVPLDEEDREKIKRVMEAIFWDAKRKNKRKDPTKE